MFVVLEVAEVDGEVQDHDSKRVRTTFKVVKVRVLRHPLWDDLC